MSHKSHSSTAPKRRSHAPMFSALGDDTRLALLTKLCNGKRYSISQLTAGSELTRQAITKHLQVLEGVGIVHAERAGRESLFEFRSEGKAIFDSPVNRRLRTHQAGHSQAPSGVGGCRDRARRACRSREPVRVRSAADQRNDQLPRSCFPPVGSVACQAKVVRRGLSVSYAV